jgi:hypothetical protein
MDAEPPTGFAGFAGRAFPDVVLRKKAEKIIHLAEGLVVPKFVPQALLASAPDLVSCGLVHLPK